MNLKQLQYFIAVVEEKQITAAAKKLNIAQPPLSYQLKQLEAEYQAIGSAVDKYAQETAPKFA